MNVEDRLPGLQGINDRVVQRDDFKKLFSDFLDTYFYDRTSGKPGSRNIDATYSNNEAFWTDALKRNHFEGMRVRLENFQIGEWLPSAPGRYFTEEARRSRKVAKSYRDMFKTEYLPLGKEYMVLGGVGSVRLSAKDISNKTHYFMCATSTGVSHEGIPLAIAESDHRGVIPDIKQHGGCCGTVEGTLRVLPQSATLIDFIRDVPRYCLYADGIDITGPPTERMLTTVAIMFPSGYRSGRDEGDKFYGSGYITEFRKSWSFASFYMDGEGERLSKAVSWLRDYSMRYSSIPNPPILTDFDEHYRHFDNPIEFSLKNLFSKGLDPERLLAYARYYGMSINIGEVVMGDKFENISNATIINRSLVQNAFNKVRDEVDEETANALKRVADEVERSGNTEAAENFNAFSEELQKPEPKKSLLRSFWGGVTLALPSILQMTDIVAKISKLYTG
jgi:hypothetical protein